VTADVMPFDDGLEYWLDTSVFYRLAGRAEPVAESVATRCRTTLNAPLEIIGGAVDEGDFPRRQAALRQYVAICGIERTWWLLPDVRVASAFGRAQYQVNRATIEDFVDTFTRATSMEVFRALSTGKPSIDSIRRGSDDAAAYYAEAMNRGLADQRASLVAQFREAVQGDAVRARKLVREETIRDAQKPGARTASLCGLAVRAGLLDEREMRAAVAAGDQEALASMIDRAQEAYDGSLDFFLRCYLIVHATAARDGRTSSANDLLDIDQLVFMRDGSSEQVLVSADGWLVKVVNETEPGRARLYEEWISEAR
jgi:hypothetical protein